jgi:hypothetical protein
MKSIQFVVIFSFCISCVSAQKKDSLVAPWWVERFKLTAGIFIPVNDISLKVSANGSVDGTNIDFQKDLGLESTGFTFLSNVQWRISRRSRISLGYYNIRRSSTKTLQKDIIFDSVTYKTNTTVDAFFNTSIYQFSYGYAIIVKPNYELGLSIGAHTVGAKAGVSANDANAGLSRNSDFGFTAPLPDLGIWGGYAFNDRFAANLEFGYLSLTVNDIKGSILTYNLVLLYRIIPQLDLLVAYTGLNFDVNATKKNVTGDFKWGYNGPSLGLSFSFGKKSWIHPSSK